MKGWGWGPAKPAQCFSLGHATLLLPARSSKAGVHPGGKTTFLGNKCMSGWSSLKPSSLIWCKCLILAQTVMKKEVLEEEFDGALVASAPSLMCSLCQQSTKMLLGFNSTGQNTPDLNRSQAGLDVSLASVLVTQASACARKQV